MTPEFSRPVDTRRLPEAPVAIAAGPDERAALARRFEVAAIHHLTATIALSREDGAVRLDGRLEAELTQACAVSGELLAVTIAEPFALRFVPPGNAVPAQEEIELGADDCDEIEMNGTVVDLGEAVAQTLSLAIDPYATGPDADRVRREAGLDDENASGPFAALAALKR